MSGLTRKPLAHAPKESRGVTKSTHWTDAEWDEVETEAIMRGLEPAVFVRNAALTTARIAQQHRSLEASLGNPAAGFGGSAGFSAVPKVPRGSRR